MFNTVISIDIHTEAKPYHIDQLFFSNVYSKYYKRYKIHFYTFFKSKCIRYIENKGVLRCPVVSCGDKSDPNIMPAYRLGPINTRTGNYSAKYLFYRYDDVVAMILPFTGFRLECAKISRVEIDNYPQ